MSEYQKFGSLLKSLRRRYHVAKGELCAALEIDEEYLGLVEQGFERPSEDLVEQIITFLGLDDNVADNLWVQAGYPTDRLEDSIAQIVHVTSAELKVNYTDMVHISVNNFGVVLNFMQHSGPMGQPVVVSRLGMSKEHAKSVADIIYKTLNSHADQKNSTPKRLSLPEGKLTEHPKRKNP